MIAGSAVGHCLRWSLPMQMKTNQLDIFCKINCSLIGIHVRSFTNCVYQCSCFLIIATFTFIFHLIRWQTIKQLLYLKMNLDRKKNEEKDCFLSFRVWLIKRKQKDMSADTAWPTAWTSDVKNHRLGPTLLRRPLFFLVYVINPWAGVLSIVVILNWRCGSGTFKKMFSLSPFDRCLIDFWD